MMQMQFLYSLTLWRGGFFQIEKWKKPANFEPGFSRAYFQIWVVATIYYVLDSDWISQNKKYQKLPVYLILSMHGQF